MHLCASRGILLRVMGTERRPVRAAPSHYPQRRAGGGVVRTSHLRLNTSCSEIALYYLGAICRVGAHRPPTPLNWCCSEMRLHHRRPALGAALRALALCPAPRQVASPAALGGGGQRPRHLAPWAAARYGLRRSCAFAQKAPPGSCPTEQGQPPGGAAGCPQGCLLILIL